MRRYLGLNSMLNLMNRWALGLHGLRFPLFMTACHMIFGSCALSPLMFLRCCAQFEPRPCLTLTLTLTLSPTLTRTLTRTLTLSLSLSLSLSLTTDPRRSCSSARSTRTSTWT